jgi:hypothetical protein
MVVETNQTKNSVALARAARPISDRPGQKQSHPIGHTLFPSTSTSAGISPQPAHKALFLSRPILACESESLRRFRLHASKLIPV